MTVKEFIRAELSHLASSFPDLRIKYAFDASAESHIVELTPQRIYYNSELLDNAWIEIVNRFHEQFPDELISFISDDSLLAIQNSELEFYSGQRLKVQVISVINSYSENYIKTSPLGKRKSACILIPLDTFTRNNNPEDYKQALFGQ